MIAYLRSWPRRNPHLTPIQSATQNPDTLTQKKAQLKEVGLNAPFALVQAYTFAVAYCRYTPLNPGKI
jgi:hypothetical protein